MDSILIKKLRDSGYRMTFVADKIGTTKTQLSLFMNGHRPLPADAETKLRKFVAEKVR